ncbi:4'-phosphopantetheinyl transferase family protein [Streptomyces sp. NRRL F-2664]|uniref:4'-phosphopantetheinyl transferase family protein n=1 Tax=Streptomyces sp. NRRL F-2664 TaxID=1463842 RepID=UPI00131DAC2D|nr:4'-phosphopantetheinyl transferase superfamily protein [Streptomyces sp. NRRL F-2664]
MNLDQDPAPWWSLLSEPERIRAKRLPAPLVRSRFIVRRGLLRAVLSEHLLLAPREIFIGTDPRGRPCLPGQPGLRISTSHSGPLGVVALCPAASGHPGIDVEKVVAQRLTPGMLAYVLTPAEHDFLSEVHPSARPTVFHTMWTGKEAVAKATGWGLARCFPSVDVLPGPGDDWFARHTGRNWKLNRLTAPDVGYTAALVTIGEVPLP